MGGNVKKLLGLSLIFVLCVGAGITNSKSGRTPVGRVFTSSTPYLPVPTVTGFGTGPTVSLSTGSSDYAGTVGVTAGTTPTNVGTVTITFSSSYVGSGGVGQACFAILSDQTGAWNGRATVRVNGVSAT